MNLGQGLDRRGAKQGRVGTAKDGGWDGAGLGQEPYLTAGAGVGFRMEMGLGWGQGKITPRGQEKKLRELGSSQARGEKEAVGGVGEKEEIPEAHVSREQSEVGVTDAPVLGAPCL